MQIFVREENVEVKKLSSVNLIFFFLLCRVFRCFKFAVYFNFFLFIRYFWEQTFKPQPREILFSRFSLRSES